MRDGVRRLVIVARDDAYGDGLSDGVRADLINAGVSPAAIKIITYSPDNPSFTSLGSHVRAFAPAGILIIGFDETADAIEAIEQAGIASRQS
jgi:ABC-type branched-subunit amino acid transport system substrate-binding protein